MEQDEYGLHTVKSAYFDTDPYDIHRPLVCPKAAVQGEAAAALVRRVFPAGQRVSGAQAQVPRYGVQAAHPHPGDLEYEGIFDDLFRAFTKKIELRTVKTINLGSLFALRYRVILKDDAQQKALIDEIRCRNGNLGVTPGVAAPWKEAL